MRLSPGNARRGLIEGQHFVMSTAWQKVGANPRCRHGVGNAQADVLVASGTPSVLRRGTLPGRTPVVFVATISGRGGAVTASPGPRPDITGIASIVAMS